MTGTMYRVHSRVLAFVAALLAAMSLGSWVAAPARAGEPAAVRVRAVFAQPVPLPAYSFLYLGNYLGFFKEEGLEVELNWAKGSVVGVQQLVSGQADFFIGAFDSVLAAAARGEDLGLQAVYPYQRGSQVRIVTLTDGPIRSFRQLKGKVVGVQTLVSVNMINTVNLALRSEGVDPASVNLVAVGIGLEAANALASRRVDAMAQVDTSIAQMENAGFKFRTLPMPRDVASISAMVSAKRDFVEKNPETVVKFARAITKGNIFFLENPEATVRIAWLMYPEVKPNDLPEDVALKQAVHVIRGRAANQSLAGGDVQMWGAISEREWTTYLRFLGIDPSKLGDRERYVASRFVKDVNAFDQEAFKKWAREYRFRQ